MTQSNTQSLIDKAPQFKFLPNSKTKPTPTIEKSTSLIYAKPKLGKSTLASQFPGALFLDFEGGLDFLDVAKIPITSWDQLRDIYIELTNSKHEYKTIVFDTIDIAIKRIEEYVATQMKIEHISDAGFGKGSSRAQDVLQKTMAAFKLAGFGVVMISHAQERELKSKTLTTTYMTCSLSPATGKAVMAMCDFIFYCYVNSEGKRLMRTKGDNKVDAGDRSGKLPTDIEMSFKVIKQALEGTKQEQPK